MVNSNNLKNIVLDAIAEFYQKYIKPETREMVEEIVDERTGPIRASQIEIERKLDVAIGDYQGQQLQHDLIHLTESILNKITTYHQSLKTLDTLITPFQIFQVNITPPRCEFLTLYDRTL